MPKAREVQRKRISYILPVWRLAIFFVILTNFVEVVFVQLAHETGEVAMLEVFGEDRLGKFLALDPRVSHFFDPRCDRT